MTEFRPTCVFCDSDIRDGRRVRFQVTIIIRLTQTQITGPAHLGCLHQFERGTVLYDRFQTRRRDWRVVSVLETQLDPAHVSLTDWPKAKP